MGVPVKPDERGVRQRVAHVPREAVDEVVLAAVRLVGDDDDVAPVGEHRVPVALLLGKELLDGGEHDAAGGDRELRPQVGAVGGLHRRLAQQIATAREGAEELIVEVVAVGEHDDGRIRHRRVQDDAPGIEGHRQALARALRVPDHADAPVARLAARPLPRLVAPRPFGDPARRCRPSGAQRLFHRHVDRMELVVAGHLLDELAAARVLEDDEVAQQVEEAPLLEHTLQHDLQLGHVRRRVLAPGDRAPGLEPLLARAERADARLHAVGGDQRRVGREQRRDLRLVGLKLLEGRPDRRVLVGGVLQLDHRQRQPVDEQHHVRPARVLPFRHGELVDGQPVVVVRRRRSR